MHPWLAVVAIRIMAIRKRTTNARWARSLGKRILNIYSGSVLRGGTSRSSPAMCNLPLGVYLNPLGAVQYPIRWEKSSCHNPPPARLCGRPARREAGSAIVIIYA